MLEGLKTACIERGMMNENWRLKLTSKRIIGNSDIAEIVFKTYRPRERKGYLHSVNVNIVRGLIYWDTLHFTNERS